MRVRSLAAVSLMGLAAAGAVPTGDAPAGWTLMYERDGFRAYERPGDPPAYRAEGTLDAGLAEVAAVLADIPREREWVSHLAESRLLEGDPVGRSVVYSRFDLPWPVHDRDAVIENVVEDRPDLGQVRVRFRAVTSPAAPERPGCVRVVLCDGEFLLAREGPGSVRVTYTIRLDPGGWLPVRLARHFLPAGAGKNSG